MSYFISLSTSKSTKHNCNVHKIPKIKIKKNTIYWENIQVSVFFFFFCWRMTLTQWQYQLYFIFFRWYMNSILHRSSMHLNLNIFDLICGQSILNMHSILISLIGPCVPWNTLCTTYTWNFLVGVFWMANMRSVTWCNFCLLLVFKDVLVDKAPKPEENQGGNMPIHKELCTHYYLLRNLRWWQAWRSIKWSSHSLLCL